MADVRVRTRQHRAVLDDLNNSGRYVTSARHAAGEAPELKKLMIPCYDWLSEALARRIEKPADASYPVWVTLEDGGSYPKGKGVILELEAPEEALALISVEGWSAVLDYRYVSFDEEELRLHREEMDKMGLSDAKACMSGFYPEIKRRIMASWDRIFVGPDFSGTRYGLLWEIRSEWVREVIE